MPPGLHAGRGSSSDEPNPDDEYLRRYLEAFQAGFHDNLTLIKGKGKGSKGKGANDGATQHGAVGPGSTMGRTTNQGHANHGEANHAVPDVPEVHALPLVTVPLFGREGRDKGKGAHKGKGKGAPRWQGMYPDSPDVLEVPAVSNLGDPDVPEVRVVYEFPTRTCPLCDTIWTISSLDRDWHTLSTRCIICDVELGPPHFPARLRTNA